MTLIDKIKADREAGTAGPWEVRDCETYGDRCKTFYQEVWNDGVDILVTTEVTRAHNDGGAANMRRIARVPDMEAALLAADALDDASDAIINNAENLGNYSDPQASLPLSCIKDLTAALAAYRKAVGDA